MVVDWQIAASRRYSQAPPRSGRFPSGRSYTPGSPSFHQWLSTSGLLAYAPGDAIVKTVKADLEKQGLTVIEDGRDNFSIAVHGSAEKVQAAFDTSIEVYERNGETFYANTRPASLGGESEQYVIHVSGLNNLGAKPMYALATNPKTH